MSEKNTNVTETVEIDPGMSVMPEGPGLMGVPTVIPELDSVLAAMPTALPAYQTTAWKNKPSTETPVDAAVMTRVEQRLVDLTNAVNGLRDSVSQLPVKNDSIKKLVFQIYKSGSTNYFQAGVGLPGGGTKTINIDTWTD